MRSLCWGGAVGRTVCCRTLARAMVEAAAGGVAEAEVGGVAAGAGAVAEAGSERLQVLVTNKSEQV